MDWVAIAEYLFLVLIVVLGSYSLRQPWEGKKRTTMFAIPLPPPFAKNSIAVGMSPISKHLAPKAAQIAS